MDNNLGLYTFIAFGITFIGFIIKQPRITLKVLRRSLVYAFAAGSIVLFAFVSKEYAFIARVVLSGTWVAGFIIHSDGRIYVKKDDLDEEIPITTADETSAITISQQGGLL